MTAPASAPEYGEFVYVRHVVGNPYGNAGSTTGVEYTVDIENLIDGGYMAFAPGSVPAPYTPPLGSRGVDPLNPALGQWAYVQNNVGTQYGVAGSTVGVEVTTHIKRLVLDGALSFTLPPTSQYDEFPLYSDNTFASLGMVKDLMYAYYGGYDGSEGDYSHLIISQRLRDAIAEEMSITYDPTVQALLDEARDYNADTKIARDAAKTSETNAKTSETNARTSETNAGTSASQALSYRNTASTHASTATTKASEASNSATTATTKAGGAATSATNAKTSETNAKTSETNAAASATKAQQHAEEFDLTVTSSTLAPGAQATVAVSGDGPAYSLAFGVPKGDKGDKGDEGEISQAQLDAAVASLVDGSPEALNTLSELATALGNDPNFATTVSTQIGQRARIDGAPAAYDTLGKLVAALQNHELGGSTDASLLTGSLTDQVDATEATVLMDYGNPGGPEAISVVGAIGMVQYMADAAHHAASLKADVDHTHDGADITGALTDQVDVTNAMIQIGSGSGGLGANLTWLVSDLDSKSDVGHKHTVADIQATGTPSNSRYLRGDGTWNTPANTTYAVPTQAEAEAGTATTARAFTAERVRQAADAAITAREWVGTQSQYNAIGTKNPNITYYIVD